MTKHAPDSCPRCGDIFICKANNASQCDCQNISLTFEETQFISEITIWDFDGACLCINCLTALKKAYAEQV